MGSSRDRCLSTHICPLMVSPITIFWSTLCRNNLNFQRKIEKGKKEKIKIIWIRLWVQCSVITNTPTRFCPWRTTSGQKLLKMRNSKTITIHILRIENIRFCYNLGFCQNWFCSKTEVNLNSDVLQKPSKAHWKAWSVYVFTN